MDFDQAAAKLRAFSSTETRAVYNRSELMEDMYLHPGKYGRPKITYSDIGSIFGKSDQWARNEIRIAEKITRLQANDMITAGCTASHLTEIAKISSPVDRNDAVADAIIGLLPLVKDVKARQKGQKRPHRNKAHSPELSPVVAMQMAATPPSPVDRVEQAVSSACEQLHVALATVRGGARPDPERTRNLLSKLQELTMMASALEAALKPGREVPAGTNQATSTTVSGEAGTTVASTTGNTQVVESGIAGANEPGEHDMTPQPESGMTSSTGHDVNEDGGTPQVGNAPRDQQPTDSTIH